MNRKQEQLKIASILYDLGLDMELIEAMTSLSHEDLKIISIIKALIKNHEMRIYEVVATLV